MGSSTSKNVSTESKVLGAKALASIARIFPKVQSDRVLVQYRQDVDIREELEALKKSMEEQVSSLSEERDKAKEEIREKSDALAAVQQERDELDERVAELIKGSRLLGDSMTLLNDQLGHAQAQTDGLRQQMERRETEMRMVTNEMAQIKTKHGQTIALLDTRTAELKGAQAFLTKADSASGADVVRMVEGLDAEILQMSAYVADHFEFGERQAVNDEIQGACDRLADLLGPKIVDHLGSTVHAHDPMLIQLACQAATAAYCRWIILAWDFDEEDFNHFLQHIYLTVRESGELTSFKFMPVEEDLPLTFRCPRGSSCWWEMAVNNAHLCTAHVTRQRRHIIKFGPSHL